MLVLFYILDEIYDFAVALFDDNTIEVVRKDWLIDDKNVHFPPSVQHNKYLKSKSDLDIMQKWKIFKIKIIKSFGELKFF